MQRSGGRGAASIGKKEEGRRKKKKHGDATHVLNDAALARGSQSFTIPALSPEATRQLSVPSRTATRMRPFVCSSIFATGVARPVRCASKRFTELTFVCGFVHAVM